MILNQKMKVRQMSPQNLHFLAAFCLLLASLTPFASAWSLEKPTVAPRSLKEGLSRRDWVGKVVASMSAASLLSLTPIQPAGAEEKENGGLLSTNYVADMLRAVPTFTIVDAKGIPYMVVGEDAKVTGYFFSTFDEADRILRLAKTSADKAIRQAKLAKEPVDENPWNKARIATVPLDVAVTIVTKSQYTKSYFQVAPAVDDVNDALAITGKKSLAEGKVPLFYMKDFTIDNPNDTSTKQSPLYFQKSELEQAYRKVNPGQKDLPEILVTELFAVVLEMVKPGGTDEDLKTLAIMPPKGSAQKARQCEKAGGKEPPFVFGQRNLVL